MTRKRIRKLTALLLLLIMSLTLFTGCGSKKNEPEITASFISAKLETMSELVSAKMTYQGIIHYKDGNVPFFTQKEFLMVYRAVVKAGIDLSAVKIDVTETEVKITVPAEVNVDINIDPESITFYAEKTGIFAGEDKEDTLEAMSAAKEDILANGGIDELKATAREEAVMLITNLLKDLIGGRSLVVLS